MITYTANELCQGFWDPQFLAWQSFCFCWCFLFRISGNGGKEVKEAGMWLLPQKWRQPVIHPWLSSNQERNKKCWQKSKCIPKKGLLSGLQLQYLILYLLLRSTRANTFMQVRAVYRQKRNETKRRGGRLLPDQISNFKRNLPPNVFIACPCFFCETLFSQTVWHFGVAISRMSHERLVSGSFLRAGNCSTLGTFLEIQAWFSSLSPLIKP